MFHCPRCYGIAIALVLGCAIINYHPRSVIFRDVHALVCTQCFFASDITDKGKLAELPNFTLRKVNPIPRVVILSGRES